MQQTRRRYSQFRVAESDPQELLSDSDSDSLRSGQSTTFRGLLAHALVIHHIISPLNASPGLSRPFRFYLSSQS